MRKILVCAAILTAFAACGKKKDPNQTNTGIPGYDTTLPKNKMLNKLKNTSWEMPSYKDANISFKPNGTTVAMNPDFVMKDARLSVLAETNDMLVFIVDDLTNSVTFSLKFKDKNTISIASHPVGSSGSGDLTKMHEVLAAEFKKIK